MTAKRKDWKPQDTSREESLRKLAGLAILVATDAPEKLTKQSCYIHSSLVAEIRSTLEAHGFDWRKSKADQDAARDRHLREGVTARQEQMTREAAATDAQRKAEREAERQLCTCGQMSYHKSDCAVIRARMTR